MIISFFSSPACSSSCCCCSATALSNHNNNKKQRTGTRYKNNNNSYVADGAWSFIKSFKLNLKFLSASFRFAWFFFGISDFRFLIFFCFFFMYSFDLLSLCLCSSFQRFSFWTLLTFIICLANILFYYYWGWIHMHTHTYRHTDTRHIQTHSEGVVTRLVLYRIFVKNFFALSCGARRAGLCTLRSTCIRRLELHDWRSQRTLTWQQAATAIRRQHVGRGRSQGRINALGVLVQSFTGEYDIFLFLVLFIYTISCLFIVYK